MNPKYIILKGVHYIFIFSGTKIKFLGGSSSDWENVETMAQKEQLSMKACIRGTDMSKR